MTTYEFILKFALPQNTNPESLVEGLAEHGCTDAAVGIGQRGRIALDFSREAESAEQAMLSALADVKRAIPSAKLVEASPDLVGLTDVAHILGCSRQNVRKFIFQNVETFPAPVHEGHSTVYRLHKVLGWVAISGRTVDPALAEVAKITHQINLARELPDLAPAVRDKLQAFLH